MRRNVCGSIGVSESATTPYIQGHSEMLRKGLYTGHHEMPRKGCGSTGHVSGSLLLLPIYRDILRCAGKIVVVLHMYQGACYYSLYTGTFRCVGKVVAVLDICNRERATTHYID